MECMIEIENLSLTMKKQVILSGKKAVCRNWRPLSKTEIMLLIISR